jgi:uncharacterized protein YjbI with pentapeptide repeats
MRGTDLGGANLHLADFTGANIEGIVNIEFSKNTNTVKGLSMYARTK